MIAIINCRSSYLNDIKEIVGKLGYSYNILDLHEIVSHDFKSYSGIIISGAPTLLTEIDLLKFIKSFEFIKTTGKPILGICLRHQAIRILYNAKVSRGKFIDKEEKIKLIEKDVLFQDIKNYSYFHEEHSEYINLPADFIRLAKSASCENEAMKHKTKILYGVQFHPEKSGNAGKTLLKNFLNICR